MLAKLGMSRPRRIPGFSYVGPYCCLFTCCLRDRRRILAATDVASLVVEQFRRAARDAHVALLAWCVMPDHLHALVVGLDADADLTRFVRLAKLRSGYACARRGIRPLWQEGFHDRVLRADDDVKTAARYVIENPVRAGLVEYPSQYQFCGSDRWTIDEILESKA